MNKHTKEPWQVHHDIDAGEWPMVMAGGVVAGVIVANVNPSSFSCVTGGNVEMPSAANAHRIVACVNACAGMDEPAAEIDQLRAKVSKLERQAAIGRRAVDDLAMLVRRLVSSLKKSDENNDLCAAAADYLRRAGLGGSPLRRQIGGAKQPSTVAVDARAMAELLEQAAEDIQEWGAYASAYFQEKHNLAANVAKYREAARRLLAGGE